jgi:hypothetical protein
MERLPDLDAQFTVGLAVLGSAACHNCQFPGDVKADQLINENQNDPIHWSKSRDSHSWIRRTT